MAGAGGLSEAAPVSRAAVLEERNRIVLAEGQRGDVAAYLNRDLLLGTSLTSMRLPSFGPLLNWKRSADGKANPGMAVNAIPGFRRVGLGGAHDPAASSTGPTSTPPPTRITGQSLASASAASMSGADTTE